MDSRIQSFGRFGIDVSLSHDTPERRLNVTAGATEAVVQFEVAEGGVEVVAPQQADHPLAEPDALGGRRRTLQGAPRLDGLVGAGLALGPRGVARLTGLRRLRLRRRGSLFRRLLLGRLGEGGAEAERKKGDRC